ncbi:hypothetical protein ACTXT7_016046 [Hymenolepis weldensis]
MECVRKLRNIRDRGEFAVVQEEQCEVMAEIPDQPIKELENNCLELEKPTKGILDVQGELDSLMKNIEINLNKARKYIKRIEDIADFVDSQICEPPKKKVRNAFEVKHTHGGIPHSQTQTVARSAPATLGPVIPSSPSLQGKPIFDFEEEEENEDLAQDDEEDGLIYHVEAIRDISSAYRDAQYEGKKALMNVMNGNAIELIFDERPLMVLKLKSAKSILGNKRAKIEFKSLTVAYPFSENNFRYDWMEKQLRVLA